jgi:hypothetical protein
MQPQRVLGVEVHDHDASPLAPHRIGNIGGKGRLPDTALGGSKADEGHGASGV